RPLRAGKTELELTATEIKQPYHDHRIALLSRNGAPVQHTPKNLPIDSRQIATLEIEQYQSQKPRNPSVAFVFVSPLFGRI
ncbi:MAG TPA: hypothetical protein VGG59_05790, partial [Acidobacteriaceae bacterium]